MCLTLSRYPVRCSLLILLVVFEYRLEVSANMNVTNTTYLKSGNSSCDLPSSLVRCNQSEEREEREERVSGFDFNFDEIQEDLMGIFSYNEQEDSVNEHHTNGTDVEDLKNKNGILNREGRHHFLNLFKFIKLIWKKNMGTLLFAYKLKFLTLFPLLAAGLFVIVKASGLAGFFFALFIASVAIKSFAH